MNKSKQILGCFVLVLSRVVLELSRVVWCCLVLYLCCLVLCRVVLVLSCVVSCCLVLCHVVTLVVFQIKFFNSIKEINWLRKKRNKLSNRGVSNIYLKVTLLRKTSQNFNFWKTSKFKKLVTRSDLGSSNSRRYHWILEETRNSSKKTTFGLWEKTILTQLRKMFRKIPMNIHATISVTLVC